MLSWTLKQRIIFTAYLPRRAITMRGRASDQFQSIECYPNNTVGTDQCLTNLDAHCSHRRVVCWGRRSRQEKMVGIVSQTCRTVVEDDQRHAVTQLCYGKEERVRRLRRVSTRGSPRVTDANTPRPTCLDNTTYWFIILTPCPHPHSLRHHLL